MLRAGHIDPATHSKIFLSELLSVLGRRVVSMGKMVADMLVAADPFLDLKSCIQDTDLYMHLGDSVLQTVNSQHAMMTHRPKRFFGVDGTIESALKSAVAVWDRIQKQDFYLLVGECVGPVKSK